MMDRPNSLAARDIAYYFHPATNARRHEKVGPMMIERGEGVRVWDDQGKEYIEGLAGLWSVAVGFGEPRLAKAAAEQMGRLPFYHSFSHKSHPNAVKLAERLVSMAPGMGKAHFTSSGSEANDLTVKMIWYYNNALGRPAKKKILSRNKGYHGVTIVSGSLTGMPNFHRDFDLPLSFVKHLTCPNLWRFGQPGETEEAFSTRLAEELDAVIVAEGPDTVAAFIGEPVMGAGGVMPPPRTYWEKIQAVLKKHDVLLIADEVITGFGRTGNMFASQTYNIEPDFMVVSKALTSSYFPLSAILFTDKVYQTLADNSAKIGVFAHGFTASGHPVGTAVAMENLDIFEEKDLVGAVRRLEPAVPGAAARLRLAPAGGRGARRRPDRRAGDGRRQGDQGAVRPAGFLRREDRGTLPRGRAHHPRHRRRDRLLPAADYLAGRHRRAVRPVRPGAEAAGLMAQTETAAEPSAGPTGATVLTSTVRTAPEDRPISESLDGVANWLRGPARREPSLTKVIDEFAWRLTAAGIGILRVGLNTSTLHPQFLGATYLWWKDKAETGKFMILHEVLDMVSYDNNPVSQTRLEEQDHPPPPARRAGGAVRLHRAGRSQGARRHRLSEPAGREPVRVRDACRLVRRRRAGRVPAGRDRPADRLCPRDLRDRRHAQPAPDRRERAGAYLGAQTGPRVLAGEIRRGSGQPISAAIWSSDLRGFTALSDRAPSERVIATLNELFDLQGKAISAHGGEILKFIGDGVLAIFPAQTPEEARQAAQHALAAARETLAAVAARVTPEGEPPLRLVIALHYGEVTYGNIGSADRVDFTVIGPAVNLVSRIEAIAKTRDLPLIVSDDFAGAYGKCAELPSLGAFELRGLEKPHELFAPEL